MPTPPLSDELAQEALDLVEHYGSGQVARKVLGAIAPPPTTTDDRARIARLRGMVPSVRKDAARIYTRERLGRMHLVIPDVQAKPGVKLDHLRWVGRFIREKRPDVIVQIGDFADMAALSVYDRNTIRGENQRVKRDLRVADEAMHALVDEFVSDDYRPEMHLTMGNHEHRLTRFVDENPHWEEIVGPHMLDYGKFGWKVHPFLKPVEIDGVRYVHYFISGGKGNAVTSAPALLRLQKKSAIMGHNQKTDVAFHPVTHQWAIFCGCCYMHDEPYLGPQGNDVRRQILVLHEVEEGKFDPMFVSLRFLEKAYGP